VTKYLAIGAAAVILLLGATCFFLFKQIEGIEQRTGSLEQSNQQLQTTVKAKTDATQGRAQVDRAVRAMPPADVLNGLR
jgi:hypothetical protein